MGKFTMLSLCLTAMLHLAGCLAAASSNANNIADITEGPVNMAAYKGGNASLVQHCTTNKDSVRLMWAMCNDLAKCRPFSLDGQILEGDPHRRSVTEQTIPGRKQVDLTVSLVTAEDAGTIRCSDFSTKVQRFAEHIVLEFPPKCTRNVDDSVELGSRLYMSCELIYHGKWQPRIRFLAPSGDVLYGIQDESHGNTARYSVTVNASRGSDGIYMAQLYFAEPTDVDTNHASNVPVIMGQTDFPFDKLTVLYGAIDIRFENNKAQYVPGDVITCSANGNPEPVYTWDNVNAPGETLNGPDLNISHHMINMNNTFRCRACNEIPSAPCAVLAKSFVVFDPSDIPKTTTGTVIDTANHVQLTRSRNQHTVHSGMQHNNTTSLQDMAPVTSEPSSNQTGQINWSSEETVYIGAGCGGGAVIIIVIIIICCCCRHRRNNQNDIENGQPDEKQPFAGRARSISQDSGYNEQDGGAIPVSLVKLVIAVSKRGLDTEGIYRKAGEKTIINTVLAQLKTHPDAVDLDEITNIHVLADAVKTLLRNRREPLLTLDLYDAFICTAEKSDNERSDYVHGLVSQLPENNRLLLDFLLGHLATVAQHERENRMKPKDIAIVFAPNLLWTDRVMSPDEAMIHARQKAPICLEILIRERMDHVKVIEEAPKN